MCIVFIEKINGAGFHTFIYFKNNLFPSISIFVQLIQSLIICLKKKKQSKTVSSENLLCSSSDHSL